MSAPSLRSHAEHVLRRLRLYTLERLETIDVLLDDETPSVFRLLAEAGILFADGATTRQIFDSVGPRLGKKNRMDRELRDYVMLPLREVGILIKGYADTTNLQVVRHRWEPKSPNNVYLVNPEFRRLIECDEEEFPAALHAWETATEERKHRLASAEAQASATTRDERLVSIALAHYCPRFLPGYAVVFVDDTDGQRIAREWKANVERLRLPLDLHGRWPDIVLNVPGTDRCWIVDCVETDGEVDPVRHHEMEEAFRARDLVIDGFTTVYRNARRFADRQSRVDNIASGTFVWIAELGGSQFRKEALKA
jgi:hypothetical protein